MGVGLLPLKAEWVWESLSPRIAQPGTTVTIAGTGFDPGLGLEVRVGGNVVANPVISAQTITFPMPSAADLGTGMVELRDNNQVKEWIFPLEPTRAVEISLDLPPGINTGQYELVANLNVYTADPDGVFRLGVPLTKPHLVAAVGATGSGQEDPLFVAMLIPGQSQATISAQSSVLAMAGLHPAIFGSSSATLTSALDALAALPGFSDAVTFYQQAAAAGGSPMKDLRMVRQMDELVVELLASGFQPTQQAAASSSEPIALAESDVMAAPPGVLAPDIIPFNPQGGNATQFLDIELEGSTDASFNDLRFSLGVGNVADVGQLILRSPVDWNFEVHEVDTSAFQTIDQIRNELDRNTAFSYVGGSNSIKSGYIRASLFSSNMDALERLSKALADALPSLIEGGETQSSNRASITVPRTRPGIYIVQAYSGNIFYGTNFPLNGTPVQQAALIKQVDKEGLWLGALGNNLWTLSVDYLSTLSGASDFLEELLGGEVPPETRQESLFGVIMPIVTNVAKTVIKSVEDPGQTGPTAQERTSEILFEAVQSIFQGVSGLALNRLSTADAGKVSTYAKSVASFFDLAGKASSLGQALERTDGILGGSTLAVERYLVVVGNPFAPIISHINPTQGFANDSIYVLGDNFLDGTDQSRVSRVEFCTFVDDQLDKSLEAEIVQVDSGGVEIRIPAEWEATFGTQREAFVCVITTDGERLLNRRMPFTFQAPVEIVSVGNAGSVSNQVFEIPLQVNLIPSVSHNDLVVFFYNSGGTSLTGSTPVPLRLSSNGFLNAEMRIQPAGNYTASIQVRQFSEGADGSAVETFSPTLPARIPFVVVEPPPLPISGNLTMTVNSLGDTISDDGQLNLIEAMIIANQGVDGLDGVIGNDNVLTGYDGDAGQINGLAVVDPGFGGPATFTGGGTTSTDTIRIDISLSGSVFTPSNPLPSLDGDKLELNGLVIDGSQLSGSPAAIVSTKGGFELRDGTIRNFSGEGIFVEGTQAAPATKIRVRDLLISNASLNGISLRGHVEDVEFLAVRVENSGENGLHIRGPGISGVKFLSRRGLTTPDPAILSGSVNGHGAFISDAFNITVDALAIGNMLDGIHFERNVIMGTVGPDSFEAMQLQQLRAVAAKNGGHGVFLGPDVTNSLVHYTDASGNGGDAYRFSGLGCKYHQLVAVRTGSFLNPETDIREFIRNKGSGIHILNGARDIQVGNGETHRFAPGTLGFGGIDDRNYIFGNDLHGIHIEGPDSGDVSVFTTVVGPGSGTQEYKNQINNILIDKASSGNVIGGPRAAVVNFSRFNPNSIDSVQETVGCWIHEANQAGLVIDNAHGNTMVGCRIYNNPIGVHIRNGARNNSIGTAGTPHLLRSLIKEEFSFSFDPITFAIRPGNYFFGNDTGLILESAGGDMAADGALIDPNRVVGNIFGHVHEKKQGNRNHVGIHLKGNTANNQIGGDEVGEGNFITLSDVAGLIIENLDLNLNPGRLIVSANTFDSNFLFGDTFISPTTGTPRGVGALMRFCTGVTFGGSSRSPNTFWNNPFGLFIENSVECVVRGNSFDFNRQAALVVRFGAENQIGVRETGGENRFARNGRNSAGEYGDVLFFGTSLNRISNNFIGNPAGPSNPSGNYGPSIRLINSERNRIGSGFKRDSNRILSAPSHGISLEGVGTFGNLITGNRIGVRRDGDPDAANAGAGIRLANGASNNIIGSTPEEEIIVEGQSFFPSGNLISNNAGAGILAEGSDVTGNLIQGNSIHSNGGDSVALTGGANSGPPVTLPAVILDGGIQSPPGNPTGLNPGSVIEFYAGEQMVDLLSLIGRTTVAPDGSWRISNLPATVGNEFSFVVTDSVTGSSSAPIPTNLVKSILMSVRESVLPDPQRPVDATQDRSILPFTIAADASRVTAYSITVGLTGDLADLNAVGLIRVYVDQNGDGLVDPGDYLVGEAPYTPGTGTVTIPLAGVSLDPGESGSFLFAISLTEAAALDPSLTLESLQIQIFSQSDFNARVPGVFSGQLTDFTSYPFISPLAEPFASGYLLWAELFFPGQINPAIVDLSADPDGDGLSNLIEYAWNTDPTEATQARPLNLDLSAPTPYLRLSPYRQDPLLVVRLFSSSDIQSWTEINFTGSAAEPVIVPISTDPTKQFFHADLQYLEAP